MIFIKKILEFFLKIFLIFGIKISINRAKSNVDFEYLEKNTWLPYLNKNNYYFNLYFETIDKSNSRDSDSFSKQIRFYSLMNIVKNICKNKKIENFVECGCWKGHSTLLISSILKENSFNKEFLVFDSFEGGLSSKVEQDINFDRYQSNTKKDIIKKNYFKSNYEDVKNLVKDYKFVKIFKGWIPAQFDYANNMKFSFVHIDVDLFNPTRDSLDFFYDKLIDGGIIVCDDYNYSDYPGAKKAVDYFLKDKDIKLFYEVPLGSCIIIK